jgi:hypothetical protein
MPQMFGNLSIRPRMVGLLAVPVAAVALLGATVAATGWGERSRAADDRRLAALAGRALTAYRAGAAALGSTGDPALDRAVAVAAERLDRLALLRAEVDRRLAATDQVAADHDRMVAGLLGIRDEADPRRRRDLLGLTTWPPGCAAPPRPCWP